MGLASLGLYTIDKSAFPVILYINRSSSNHSPIGPFRDAPNRAMNVMIDGGNWNYNTDSCSGACKDYKYFALQDGYKGLSQCFCSNSFENSTKYGIDDCGPGGGAWCNFIYQHDSPSPIPKTLGKLYYGVKNKNESKYTLYDYNNSYTNGAIFSIIRGFSSPGYDIDKGVFNNVSIEEAKQLTLEKNGVGFTYDKSTRTCFIKENIYPHDNIRRKKNDTYDMYVRIPVPINNTYCPKSVVPVSTEFIEKNTVISSIPMTYEKKCIVEKKMNETINANLMKISRKLIQQMTHLMNTEAKYISMEPSIREKFFEEIAQYKNIIKKIDNTQDSMQTNNQIAVNAQIQTNMNKYIMSFIIYLIIFLLFFAIFGFGKYLLIFSIFITIILFKMTIM